MEELEYIKIGWAIFGMVVCIFVGIIIGFNIAEKIPNGPDEDELLREAKRKPFDLSKYQKKYTEDPSVERHPYPSDFDDE